MSFYPGWWMRIDEEVRGERERERAKTEETKPNWLIVKFLKLE